MRRHNPLLYTHPEDDADDEEDGGNWGTSSRHSYTSSPSMHSTGSKSRTKARQRTPFSPGPNTATLTAPSYKANRSIYNQFVKRYRSGFVVDDDSRNDPDSHYYSRRFGLDAGESDDEDQRGPSLGNGEAYDRLSSIMLETEPIEPQTLEDRERLEWQAMLSSVLAGDVLKSENTRINAALTSSADEDNNHEGLWLGIRAKIDGRADDEEKRILDDRRLRTVDSISREVLHFRVSDIPAGSDVSPADHALLQVNTILRKLDNAYSLYPSIRSFCNDCPAASDPEFQARCDTLNTWSTVITSLRQQIFLLRKWTGSETLDVTQPVSNGTTSLPGMHVAGEGSPGTPFVERLLKEESMQRQFEKGSMTTIHALVGTTRDAHVNLAPMFKKMNLPSFERELVPLVSFLTNLTQAVLRVRVDYAQKLKNPDILIIDQMTEDLKVKIGFACTLKRQYEAFLLPDPGGNWKLPPCISDDYDSVILEALTFFFRLIHWKLKSGSKAIYFKETDLIEAQWATFSDVSLTVPGGASLVAEQLCALTNKLMVRVTNYFENQIRLPTTPGDGSQQSLSMEPNGSNTPNGSGSVFHTYYRDMSIAGQSMSGERLITWYTKVLEGIKQRCRKLQRLARVLVQRFSNAAEYDLSEVSVESFIAALIESKHALVYTSSFEEDGTYILVPAWMQDHPDRIQRLLMEAFEPNESDEASWLMEKGEGPEEEEEEQLAYLIIISPRTGWLWQGPTYMFNIPRFDLKMADNRVRLVADGPGHRLALAKRRFNELFLMFDDETGEQIELETPPPTCLIEQEAHLPLVNHELRKITRATNRLAETIVDSVHFVRNTVRDSADYQELLENWYAFASEYGQHLQKHMDYSSSMKFHRHLIKLAISWVSFICDDCDPNDRRTFRWAVLALEFTLGRTRRNNILQLPAEQFEMLRQKVASCMTLLISHFDILGARSTLEAKKEKERQEELRQSVLIERARQEELAPTLQEEEMTPTYLDTHLRKFWERATSAVSELEKQRAEIGQQQHAIGRVLDEEKLVDRSLAFLAGSSSNISIRWQQGRFIGAGSFGSVYLAVNLDTGSLMAVKEIKFQEVAGLSNLYSQIKDELSVMEVLHHPNVVEYYGIEVHRDKVYIFEEFCQGGSLAALLEHGRIEDEGIIQVYTMQMLEGLAYLHSMGVVHRDIKPDNILLDHQGVIKYVDFGAAKILAKNQRTIQRTRRGTDAGMPNLAGGLGTNNSLTGTPMYMSPEVIRNNKRGRHGAMDIWSLGCVVLECATGRKPWSNLDNEWAIMFHIGVATQHPPLPEPGQLSEKGIDFIKQCLTIDPMQRPTAMELMEHPWMLDFQDFLRTFEKQELATSPPAELPADPAYEQATVARQAAIEKEKEVEAIQSKSPTTSPFDTSDSSPGLSENPSTEFFPQ